MLFDVFCVLKICWILFCWIFCLLDFFGNFLPTSSDHAGSGGPPSPFTTRVWTEDFEETKEHFRSRITRASLRGIKEVSPGGLIKISLWIMSPLVKFAGEHPVKLT